MTADISAATFDPPHYTKLYLGTVEGAVTVLNFLCNIVLHSTKLHQGPVSFVGTHSITRHVVTAGLDGKVIEAWFLPCPPSPPSPTRAPILLS